MMWRLILAAVLVLILKAAAQVPALTASSPNVGLNFLQNADGSFSIWWWTTSGNTYYVQQSDDLIHWNYLPIAETGSDQPAAYGVTSTASSCFFRLQYTQDGALPSDWLAQYGLPSTAGPSDTAPSGNGLTNLQAFLNGADPNDYYNGALPSLAIGSGQFGAPGQVLTIPVIVTPVTPNATDGGAYNAPVTLTISSGGAKLSLDPSGTNGWISSITARATNTVPQSAGYPTDVAQVYVLLPNTAGDQSTITATVTTAGQTTSAQSWVMTFDGTLAPPTALTATPVAPDTIALNWTSGNSSLATTLQASFDGGVTWITLGAVAPGVTSATVTGLSSDQQVLFQALTGGESVGSGNSFDASTPASDPLPGQSLSAPTTGATATPLSQTVLLSDQTSASLYWYGYNGFQTPSNRYLSAIETFTYDSPPSLNGVFDVCAHSIDPFTGINTLTVQNSNVPGTLTDWAPLYTIFEDPPAYVLVKSDTFAIANNYSPPGQGYTFDGKATLGTTDITGNTPIALYSFDQFVANTISLIPAFPNTFQSIDPTAYYTFSADLPDTVGVDTCYIAKLQYKFLVNSDPNMVVCWKVVFTPDDGSASTTQYMNWPTLGAQVSPVFTIDPTSSNPTGGGTVVPGAQPAAIPGTYQVMTTVPQIQVTESPGGGMVPSNLPGGQKHFVCPKAVGSYMTLTAGNLTANDMTANGGAFFLDGDGEPVNDGTGLSWSVPTGTPNKYTITLYQNGTAVDTLNVWVVWADGIWAQGTSIFTQVTKQTFPTINKGNLLMTQSSISQAEPWRFLFTIQPSEIITGTDIPNLKGANDTSPPGTTHPLNGATLAGGADHHWDVSRQMSIYIANPNLISPGDFPKTLGRLYTNQPVTQDAPILFPTDPVIGNDDSNTIDESNDPYLYTVKLFLSHDVGEITSFDYPQAAFVPYRDAVSGQSFSQAILFREFARLEINRQWYVISDPISWYLTLGVTADSSNTWQSTASGTGISSN